MALVSATQNMHFRPVHCYYHILCTLKAIAYGLVLHSVGFFIFWEIFGGIIHDS